MQDAFTPRSTEALGRAQDAALTGPHAEVTPLHLAHGLLADGAASVAPLLARLDVDATALAAEVRRELERLPKVQGWLGSPESDPDSAIQPVPTPTLILCGNLMGPLRNS